jgi:HK97 family phage major capsid protein
MLVRTNARSEPSAVVLNPTDAQNIDLLKRNNEANNFAGPGLYGMGAARLWNVPVVETNALSAGTALVCDFSKAVLFDRLSLSVTLGTISDQFIRNMVTTGGATTVGRRQNGSEAVRPRDRASSCRPALKEVQNTAQIPVRRDIGRC